MASPFDGSAVRGWEVNLLYQGGRTMKSRAYLDAIYSLPRETRSLVEAFRLRHWDVPELPDAVLVAEERAVLRRLDYDHDLLNVAWLKERVAAIRAERDRRARPTSRPAAASGTGRQPVPSTFRPIRREGSRG